MRRLTVLAIVVGAIALAASSASAQVHYTCHSITHGGFTTHDAKTIGVDCGTFAGWAKRIIDHGTGFLTAAKWTCHEVEHHATGIGFVHCVRSQYIELQFHFSPAG